MSPLQRPSRDEVSIFAATADFEAWMESHHDSATSLWVGYWRSGVDRTAMSYAESVDVGLAYGWIDSVTYRVDDEMRADDAGWAFWQAQLPSYRRGATRWILSAKRPETRHQRLATLVEDCAAERWIKPFAYGATRDRRS